MTENNNISNNQFQIDTLTMLNGFSYITYMYLQGEGGRVDLPSVPLMCYFWILKVTKGEMDKEFSLKDIEDSVYGVKRKDLRLSQGWGKNTTVSYALLNLAKEGVLERTGPGTFQLKDKKTCEEAILPLLRYAEDMDHKYSETLPISEKLQDAAEKLFQAKMSGIGEVILNIYSMQKGLLRRCPNLLELLILYYTGTLSDIDTYEKIHTIVPHQSIPNIRACCNKLVKEGYVRYDAKDSHLWGEEGYRKRQAKIVCPEESGLKLLEENRTILNEQMNLLLLDETQKAAFRELIRISLMLESRACYDPLFPEKPERRDSK
jgi:hypothetical protein